jgi:hypothetical protein
MASLPSVQEQYDSLITRYSQPASQAERLDHGLDLDTLCAASEAMKDLHQLREANKRPLPNGGLFDAPAMDQLEALRKEYADGLPNGIKAILRQDFVAALQSIMKSQEERVQMEHAMMMIRQGGQLFAGDITGCAYTAETFDAQDAADRALDQLPPKSALRSRSAHQRAVAILGQLVDQFNRPASKAERIGDSLPNNNSAQLRALQDKLGALRVAIVNTRDQPPLLNEMEMGQLDALRHLVATKLIEGDLVIDRSDVCPYLNGLTSSQQARTDRAATEMERLRAQVEADELPDITAELDALLSPKQDETSK